MNPDVLPLHDGRMSELVPTWDAAEGFASYVTWLRDQALEESPRPAHFVA
jgi:hypothetical protein